MPIDIRNIGSISPNGTGAVTVTNQLDVTGNVDLIGTPAPQYMINGVPIGGAAGSNGQIQFNNNDAFAASANLFWDSVNSRVGINTTTPQAALDVVGVVRAAYPFANPSQGIQIVPVGGTRGAISGGSYGAYDELDIDGNPLLLCRPDLSNGRVGIGILTPQYKLDVDGQINIVWNTFGANSSLGAFSFTNGTITTPDQRVAIISAFTDASIDSGALIFETANAGVMSERMRIDSQGHISVPNLPLADPGTGSKQLWADPSDGYRVKFAV